MTQVCCGPECSRPASAQRNPPYCPAHYQQANKRDGQLRPLRKKTQKEQTCSGPGCTKPARSKGLCRTHSNHLARDGEMVEVWAKAGRRSHRCRMEGCDVIDPRGYCDEHEFDLLGACAYPECERSATRTSPFCRSHRHRSNYLKHQYGITLEDWVQLAESQGWRCAICNKIEPLHVDHCHTVGHVRGLLCGNCNRGLGLFFDSPEALMAAAKYARGH